MNVYIYPYFGVGTAANEVVTDITEDAIERNRRK